MIERLGSRVVLGTIAPVSLMLAGWWGALGLLGDSLLIPYAALGGFALGLVVDVTVLRSRMDSLFSLSTAALIFIAVFYAFMIYGFFMGLPVPILLVSLGWGYVAARPRDGRLGERGRRVCAASRGSALIMSVMCCVTAWLAFSQPSIASEVRGMLGLSFTPTIGFLAVFSLVGGLALVALAYALPVMIAKWGHRERGEPVRGRREPE